MRRDVQLLYEVGTLRHLPRAWQQFGGVDFANVAEHSFRVAWIALILAREEGADVGRAVQMALIHDLEESRTGDRNYVSRRYSSTNEIDAVSHSVRGTSVREHVLELFQEYEERQTLTSRIVKDADNLDCDLELAERSACGYRLSEVLRRTRRAVYEQLHTETARRIFRTIEHLDPNSWHVLGPNRMNAGDWSQHKKPIQMHLFSYPDDD